VCVCACVCVCERGWERGRESMFVCVCVCDIPFAAYISFSKKPVVWGDGCVCVCMCVIMNDEGRKDGI
jgi:hypothetical protein